MKRQLTVNGVRRARLIELLLWEQRSAQRHLKVKVAEHREHCAVINVNATN